MPHICAALADLLARVTQRRGHGSCGPLSEDTEALAHSRADAGTCLWAVRRTGRPLPAPRVGTIAGVT
jgi:hypothetical protein